MVCKPPFEVELTKGDGKVLALQCSFPSQDQMFEDAQYQGQGQDAEQIGTESTMFLCFDLNTTL